jgi:nucleoprotein TPR
MEQEKELLQAQTTWLNDELKAKSEELLSLSRQKGNEVLELKCSLENKEDEVCSFKLSLNIFLLPYERSLTFLLVDFQLTRIQDQAVSLKASNEQYQKQVEDFINKLKEVS